MDQPKDSSDTSVSLDATKPSAEPDAAPAAPTLNADAAPAIELPKADQKPARKFHFGAFASAIKFTSPIKLPRIGRFAQLAAAMALAAGFGSFVGAMAAAGLITANTPAPAPVAAAPSIPDSKDIAARLNTELATLKTAIETTGRNANAQFAKLAERFDRTEKAQAEPAAKLARIGETLDRLEKRPPATIPATTTAAASSSDITGSIAEKQPARPAVVEGWVIRDIYDGIALIEGRRGLIEVEPGSNIPGVGRVETIRKQDGRWVVVTSKGHIVSAR